MQRCLIPFRGQEPERPVPSPTLRPRRAHVASLRCPSPRHRAAGAAPRCPCCRSQERCRAARQRRLRGSRDLAGGVSVPSSSLRGTLLHQQHPDPNPGVLSITALLLGQDPPRSAAVLYGSAVSSRLPLFFPFRRRFPLRVPGAHFHQQQLLLQPQGPARRARGGAGRLDAPGLVAPTPTCRGAAPRGRSSPGTDPGHRESPSSRGSCGSGTCLGRSPVWRVGATGEKLARILLPREVPIFAPRQDIVPGMAKGCPAGWILAALAESSRLCATARSAPALPVGCRFLHF